MSMPENLQKKMIDGATYDGETYALTATDLKKVSPKDLETLKEEAAAEIDADKDRLGKRYAVRKRDAVASCLRVTAEYRRGLGQGKLDKLNGREYASERLGPDYNLGYHEGYVMDTFDIKKEAEHNPNFWISLHPGEI